MIATSGFDMLSCGPLSRRDSGDPLWEDRQLGDRAFHVPDKFRVQVRTTAAEVTEIGSHMGAKLSKAKGPTRVMVPTRGWSSLSTEGEQLFDPESDAALVPALRQALTTDITIEELDLELNSNEFATCLVNALHEMIEAGSPSAIANT